MDQGDQMSYMYLVLTRGGEPGRGIRLMDVPVEWRDGGFVVTGELQDRPAREADLLDMLDEGSSDPLVGTLATPEGWTVAAHFWQPMRYVPSSGEVRQHARKEAVKKMLDLGITTPEQARKLLEDNDA